MTGHGTCESVAGAGRWPAPAALTCTLAAPRERPPASTAGAGAQEAPARQGRGGARRRRGRAAGRRKPRDAAPRAAGHRPRGGCPARVRAPRDGPPRRRPPAHRRARAAEGATRGGLAGVLCSAEDIGWGVFRLQECWLCASSVRGPCAVDLCVPSMQRTMTVRPHAEAACTRAEHAPKQAKATLQWQNAQTAICAHTVVLTAAAAAPSASGRALQHIAVCEPVSCARSWLAPDRARPLGALGPGEREEGRRGPRSRARGH